MKYLPLILVFLLASSHMTSAQFLWFESKYECSSKDQAVLDLGEQKLTAALDEMMKEGKVFNFDKDRASKDDKIIFSYYLLAEDEAKFKSIKNEWMKRAGDHSLKAFWQACPVKKDTLINKTKIMFPVIKDFSSPVAVVPVIDEMPDPKIDYNIVVDFTVFPTMKGNKEKMDSSRSNWGLGNVGRIYNLHVAAGIPKEKVKMVIAVHGAAARSFLSNEEYQKKYKRDNPNLSIIKELNNAGVKFLLCGQSVTWMGMTKAMLVPEAKLTLTAQTTLTSYQMKGFATLYMHND